MCNDLRFEELDTENIKSKNMFNRHIRCDSYSGFSLIELIVVIAIVSIILAIASPNYAGFINREKVAALSEEYSLALSVVRSNAIKSGMPVFLCASNDNESCGGQWKEGWLAFRDENSDTNLSVDDTVVLKRSLGSSITEISVTSLAGDDVDKFSYNYRGAPNIAIAVEVSRGDQSQSMSVTPFGRTRRDE